MKKPSLKFGGGYNKITRAATVQTQYREKKAKKANQTGSYFNSLPSNGLLGNQSRDYSQVQQIIKSLIASEAYSNITVQKILTTDIEDLEAIQSQPEVSTGVNSVPKAPPVQASEALYIKKLINQVYHDMNRYEKRPLEKKAHRVYSHDIIFDKTKANKFLKEQKNNTKMEQMMGAPGFAFQQRSYPHQGMKNNQVTLNSIY